MTQLETIPPHLLERSWLEFEEQAAFGLCENLASELEGLDKKVSAKRVHDTRVALRRWDSIWDVLERDGWSTKKYEKRIGKHLRVLRKLLGKLRDWDVNIETGESLGVPEEILMRWIKRRDKTEKKVRAEIKDMDIPTLVSRLRKFLKKRPFALRHEIAETDLRQLAASAYAHLEPFLEQQEANTRKLERNAKDWESLHQLRLSIKAWRYFLTELFGLTNLELVKGQQILGKYNDLHRILILLREEDEAEGLAKSVIAKTEAQTDQLMKEFTEFRKRLPYGLRPSVVTIEKR